MITILNGKLTIPESERFIGFAGDNLARKIEFFISGANEADRIYRLYLTFDDGTVNYFVLPSELTSEGVKLLWKVQRKHIFKSGNVRAQIKAFKDSGVVYHTTSDTFIVGNSAEFSDNFAKGNTEFLEYEEKLNNLLTDIKDISVMTPYVGENGNWFVYDSEKSEYIDSGKNALGEGAGLTDGAVKTKHLAESFRLPDSRLEESYWKIKSFIPATSYANLDSLFDNADADNAIYQIKFSGLSTLASVAGSGDFVCFASYEKGTLLLLNKANGEMWSYAKNSNTLEPVSSSVGGNSAFVNAGFFATKEELFSYEFKSNTVYYLNLGIKFDDIISMGTFTAYYSSGENSLTMAIFPANNGVSYKYYLGEDRVVKNYFSNRINDSGNYYSSQTVEGALQEIGKEIMGLDQLLAQI